MNRESEERMQLSGNRGESSQNIRCGLIGSALFMARASSTFHHSSISFSSICRHDRSSLRFKSGMSARSVSALSPIRFTSIG